MISPSCRRDRRVCDAIRDLRTSTIELRDNLAGLERDWLVGQLLASRGVCEVDYPAGTAVHRLTVRYDADELNGAELVDLLHVFGFRARSVVLAA